MGNPSVQEDLKPTHLLQWFTPVSLEHRNFSVVIFNLIIIVSIVMKYLVLRLVGLHTYYTGSPECILSMFKFGISCPLSLTARKVSWKTLL